MSGAIAFAASWYTKQKDWLKLTFCQAVLGGTGGSYAGIKAFVGKAVDHDNIMHAEGFVVFRRMWQNCIGPSRCICDRIAKRKAGMLSLVGMHNCEKNAPDT